MHAFQVDDAVLDEGLSDHAMALADLGEHAN